MDAHKVIATIALALISLAAARPTAHAQLAYCQSDIQRLCAGIRPGDGRLEECLKAHENEVTVGCAKSLQHLKSQMGK